MLIYLGTGERRYGEKPLGIQRRRAWEFQAVLNGKIGPTLPDGPLPAVTERLWVFPPGHLHGWVGENAKAAQVAVFHFLSVPEPLKQLVSTRGYIDIGLDRQNRRHIRELVQKVSQYWSKPQPGMMICYEYALMSLSLMVFESSGARLNSGLAGHRQERVGAAVEWYAERMEENPGLEDIAKAAGFSIAHLRRLFQEVLQASPNQIMDQLRFQRAMQLMADPEIKLEEVGFKCGFSSAASFSRAFKAKFGCSPQSWRAASHF